MADRGKWAESEVRKELQAMEAAHLRFTFNRIPDAKAGSFQPAAADFQWFFDTALKGSYTANEGIGVFNANFPWTRNGLIEVKEIEHLTRLPHGKFGTEKIAHMKKRQLAGAECMVLVAHKLKGMRKPDVTWRCAPFEFFRDTVYEKGVGSWDLSEFPLVDMPAVIRGLVP